MENENKLYNASGIEVQPESPVVNLNFSTFFSKEYRIITDENFIGGKMFVKFIIEKDVKLINIEVMRDLGFNTKEEAIRVLSKSPNWTPGSEN